MPNPPGQTATSDEPAIADSETLPAGSRGAAADDLAGETEAVGAVIGRYVVLEIVGTGGMGTVMRAYDPKLHREVALKRLRSRARGAEANARLVREAQALAQLSHPSVVAVYDVGLDAGQVIVTMELIRGPNLDQWLVEPRPWRERARALLEAGRGLAAAHRVHLVHRDFKPANVMITPDGLAKVTDFGLAKPAAVEDSSESDVAREHALAHLPAASSLDAPMPTMTRADVVMGTPAYMAPEQHEGAATDPAADQFAYCVTLWQVLTGHRPFSGSLAELVHAKREGPPPWPRAVVVSPRFAAAIRRGLAPRPEQRWPSMDALLDELTAALRPPRARWRSLALPMVLGGAVLAGVLVQGRLQQRCEGAHEQLAVVWNDDARARVRQGIEAATDAAPPLWDRVSHGLDDYAAAWIESHREACEATTVRGEQSSTILDLRMACLHRARGELRASVDLLSDMDAWTALRAVELVERLPELERCLDVDALLAEAPPPADPTVRAAIEALRDRLSQASSLHRVGRYQEALEAVRMIATDAEALGYAPYPPFMAELAALEGLCLEALGRFEEAEATLRRGAWLAIEHGAMTTAVRAIATWSFVLDERLGRNDEGMLAAQLGLRLARHLADPLLVARALDRVASALQSRGDWQEAEASYREALAVLEGAATPDELEIATVLNDLGGLLHERRRGPEALAVHHRALQIRERLVGESHPYVGSSLINLGNAFHMLGQLDEAQRSQERALAILERAYGDEHALTMMARGNLAALLVTRGELDRAASMLEQLTRDRERISGPDHFETGRAYNNLGALEKARGNPTRAREHFARTLAIWTAALGPEHPQLRSAHYNLGVMEDELGHDEAAIACFERALVLAGDAPPVQRGNIELALAGVLWKDPTTRARARTMGEQALATYERAAGAHEERAQAQAWLLEHGG